eukprot:CAMPEP_0116029256 /NCGR_PEP_ID=MMETSP0321-20121206/16031_1 /TAXON_ID=163516 /ORGANISM="Leptocylindrus danicus var. danicus, Strain B650" /LENGTH=259 /DNA_ID=CAMNT_0003503597 /DNA_START=127 /DNA_END=903 /DNA_ORIENTATION=-
MSYYRYDVNRLPRISEQIDEENAVVSPSSRKQREESAISYTSLRAVSKEENKYSQCTSEDDTSSASSSSSRSSSDHSLDTEKSPTSVLDWLGLGSGGDGNKNQHHQQHASSLKEHLRRRKQNETISRAIKMSSVLYCANDSSAINEFSRNNPALFDDDSVGSGSTSTSKRPSIKDSITAHLLLLHEEKEEEIAREDVSQKYLDAGGDEEMLEQLVASSKASFVGSMDDIESNEPSVAFRLCNCDVTYKSIPCLVFMFTW